MKRESIELLAPARDKQCGMAAIDHGADAVYIGADRFGARSAAGNSMADIADLCNHAHLFRARVYLTLNTILYDNELEAARDLVSDAWNCGVDGVIIQDIALLQMDLPPIPLHASTQMNNVEPEHVRFLEAAGISRVVLARELDLDAINKIRKATTVPLEAFVHGALCVSYSGRCWMSAAMGGRSANRGACGQPCRLDWDLEDEQGTSRARRRHLLSLKDMDRSSHLEKMLDAGISAFKIEGRLKDMAYVKNLTAFYRRAIDDVLEGRPAYYRASEGTVSHFFTPNPRKTFHRGATDYFIAGKRSEIWNFKTPKAIGQRMGTVRHIEKNFFTLKEKTDLTNGDGICFFGPDEQLYGMKVNRVTRGEIYPAGSNTLKRLPLKPGTSIFRNHDHQFKKLLDGHTAERKLSVTIRFFDTDKDFLLEMDDGSGNCARVREQGERIPANRPESVEGIIVRQLGKLGDSPFEAAGITVETGPWYFRPATLNRMRRQAVELLIKLRQENAPRPLRRPPADDFDRLPYPVKEITAEYNVANALSEQLYTAHGCVVKERAYEQTGDKADHILMTTKHCLRYAFGACPLRHGAANAEDWAISREGKRFHLRFDCSRCRMYVAEEKPDTQE